MSLPINKCDVFIDFGSGMGRTLIVAATRPFGKVIGVEVSSYLISIARDNIERARKKLTCQDIRLFQSDAAQYQVLNDVTVCFLFNPFRGEVLRDVFANIRKSLDKAPRRIAIIYHNPPEQWQSEANCNWVTKTREFTSHDGVKSHIYVSDGICGR
jgi:SAM-dependent methyltransferase